MSRDRTNYTHADTGTKPSSLNFEADDRPNSEYFDWWWYTISQAIDGHADEFDELDSNDDGVVDDSDKFDGTGPADGNAGNVLTTDGSTTSWSQKYEGFSYDDGTSEMVKVGENRFGAEGTTTTSTSATTIAASDFVFNPDDYKNDSGEVYIRLVYHLKHATDSGNVNARLYRQDAASPVDGSNANVGDTTVTKTLNNGWGFADTGWVELSGDSGFESYQIQLWSGDGYEVAYNSIAIWFGHPQE